MGTRTALVFALAWIAAGCGTGESPGIDRGDLLIVTTPELLEGVEAYAAFRGEAGYRVEVVVTGDLPLAGGTLADAVAARVQTFAAALPGDRPGFLLFAGDAEEQSPEDPAYVPIRMAQGGTLEYSWWQVGDGPYADLDGDQVPDLAVGRLPFRSAGELAAYQARLAAFETNAAPGPWDKTLNAFAGEGGFGPEIDGMLEMVAGWVFDEMSYDFDLSMTYASESSSYYLPWGRWTQQYASSVQAGAVSIPYIGHTLGEIDCCGDEPPARRALLTFFSCSDGTFQTNGPDDPHPSLAEDLLLRPEGPIATLAATAVSHPYGNAVLPRELGHALLDLRAPTYGEAVLQAKQGAVLRIDSLRQSIDAAAALYTTEPLPELILEHVVMYNLLGDPTAPTRLAPSRIRLDPPPGVSAGDGSLGVSGRVSNLEEGTVEVTFELSRAALRDGLPDCSAGCTDEQYAARWALANDKVLARATGGVAAGRFALTLDLPPLAAGTYHLKAFAQDEAVDAVGSREVVVR